MAFCKGEVVYSVLRGRGVVLRVFTDKDGFPVKDYPVMVKFDNKDVGFFTIGGKTRRSDIYPELYEKEKVPYEKRTQVTNKKENLKQYR